MPAGKPLIVMISPSFNDAYAFPLLNSKSPYFPVRGELNCISKSNDWLVTIPSTVFEIVKLPVPLLIIELINVASSTR